MSQPNDNLQATLQAVNDSMLEGLGQLADYFGYNKVLGQLYGALLLSPSPMSLDDLVDQLGKSKASISMNVRTLEHMGIVREVWVRETRRKYYEAESDLWKVLTNVLGSRELRDIDRALNVLESNVGKLRERMPKMDEEQKEVAQHYIARIDQLSDFFRLARVILTSLMDHGRGFAFSQFLDDNHEGENDS